MDNMVLVRLKSHWPVLLTHLAILTSLTATNVTPMGDVVYLSFNGIALPNNTYIGVDTMGRMDNNSLICHTNNRNCCHIFQTIEEYPLGEWRYPNGSIVHFIDFRDIDDYPTFGRNRNRSIARLWRVLEPEERGQFCCRIPDVDYVNHTLCSHIVDIVPFTITVQPSSQYVGRGENATFSVTVKSTTNLSYQWLKNGEAIKDTPLKYKGATKSILAVLNVSLQDEGEYRCAITDHTGVALSDPVSLCSLSLNENTINCLCFTGISKDLCEARKSAADDSEKLSQLIKNITLGKLQASDITFATALLERFGVASFQNEEIRENFLTIMDNLILSNEKELIKSQITSNTSLRILACLNGFADHVHISNHSDASALAIFKRESFVLLIHNNITENFTFNMEHSDKQITLTTDLHSLQNITASVTAVVRDSIFENLQSRSHRQRISYSIFLKENLFQSLDSGEGLSLQSIVFGIRINDAQIVNLSSPIEVYFRPDKIMRKDGELLCGRWSTSHYGVWHRTACEITALNTNGSPMYKTSFNQFGHFGLLLDLAFETNPLPERYSLALAVISYVLLTISALCLIALIITYLTAKELRSSQHCQILINLSLSLLFLYFGFLIAAHASPVPILCGISAALMQFFFLVYFGWTSVEAFFLYRNLVKILLQNTPSFVLKAALLIYSSSLLITALSAGPGYKSYPYHTQKDPRSIFLCRANYFPFWFGQILPFVATNIFNWSLFTIIIISVCKHRTNVDEQGKRAKEFTKSNVTMTIGLANLCGLGWIFGLAASSLPIEELTFTFQLLFNIFVGSQGMLLFFFHCVRNPQVHKQWKIWFTYTSGSVCFAVIPSTLSQKLDLSKSGSIKPSVQVSSLSHTVASVGNAEDNSHLTSHKDDQSIS